jgi:N utilization substance protein A
VIVQKVREAERDRQYGEFKDRIGEIVNGVVKRVEYGNVIVDLGRGEAIIRRDECCRAKCSATATASAPIIYDVRRETARPADFPVAHASAVHGEAVRAGSAGNL